MSDTTKKYVSIPSIDNCDLPISLIRKCKAAYTRYGKYKIYDIINNELNTFSRYNHEQLEGQNRNRSRGYGIRSDN